MQQQEMPEGAVGMRVHHMVTRMGHGGTIHPDVLEDQDQLEVPNSNLGVKLLRRGDNDLFQLTHLGKNFP